MSFIVTFFNQLSNYNIYLGEFVLGQSPSVRQNILSNCNTMLGLGSSLQLAGDCLVVFYKRIYKY